MTTRIWFTGEDLARTRLILTLGPLVETTLSVIAIWQPAFAWWRQQTLPRLPAQARSVLSFLPDDRHWLDLITQTGPTASIEEGIDRLLKGPDNVVGGAEVDAFAGRPGGTPVPPGRRPLLADGCRSRAKLAAALLSFHAVAVRPYWPRILEHLRAEQAHRTAVLLSGGVDALLASLGSEFLRWDPPVLEVRDRNAGVCDLRLDGHGIVLAPSVFTGPRPIVLTPTRDLATSDPHTVAYSTPCHQATLRRIWLDSAEPKALPALIGTTRTKILTAAAAVGGTTTTDLARQAGVSVSSASEHTTVLRGAGLLVTTRVGGAVHHTTTTLGDQLLLR